MTEGRILVAFVDGSGQARAWEIGASGALATVRAEARRKLDAYLARYAGSRGGLYRECIELITEQHASA